MPDTSGACDLPAAENRRHYAGLDGLRAVAVLMVMFAHYIPVPPQYNWGWTGVRIFFVLSGFLITGILYDTQAAPNCWSVFYARRTLRIFPLYYGALLLGIFLYPFFRWQFHPSYLLWPFYLQNYARFIWPSDIASGVVDHLRATRVRHVRYFLFYGHFWSLCVEEQFYLLWPLVVFSVKRRAALMKLCVTVIVLSPLARLLCSLMLSRTLLEAGFEERFTFLQFDGLLLGALLALWMRGPCPDLTLLGKRCCALVATIVAVSAVLCPLLYHRPLLPAISNPIFASVGYTCINFAAAGVLLMAIDPDTRLSRLLQSRALRWIGTVSYGVYVLHDMPHFFYSRITPFQSQEHLHSVLTFLVAVPSTLLLAGLSFRYFERPFLRLKDRFQLASR